MSITIEQKDELLKYAELKASIKALELQAEELNPKVLQIMELGEVEEIALPNDQGKLTLGSRRNWKYTKDTLDLKARFDEAKKFEEQTGAASYTEKKYVVFKQKENDGE